MIKFKTLKQINEWNNKALVSRNGKSAFFEASRGMRLFGGLAQEEKAEIKVTEGVALPLSEAKTLICNIHDIFSPLVANVKSGSDLVATVDAWAFKASAQRFPRGTRMDVVIVQENFGEELEKHVAGTKKDEADQLRLDVLARFLFRLLRMVDQRGLLAPNLTQATIIYDGRGFKLRGTADFALRNLNDTSEISVDQTYASPLVLEALTEQNDAHSRERWRRNGSYSAALTLLQLAKGMKRAELKAMRKANGVIATVETLTGNNSQQIREAILQLLNGESIDRALEKKATTLFINPLKPLR